MGTPGLGYYMGSKICQALCEISSTKAGALRTIIAMKDPRAIIEQSEYSRRFQSNMASQIISEDTGMIVRLWKTRVDKASMEEYEENERNRSTPMFRKQPGCLGVLFLRSRDDCFALTFWKDMEAVERLKTSKSYQEASSFYSDSGMLISEPSLQVFEVKEGFLDSRIAQNLGF